MPGLTQTRLPKREITISQLCNCESKIATELAPQWLAGFIEHQNCYDGQPNGQKTDTYPVKYPFRV